MADKVYTRNPVGRVQIVKATGGPFAGPSADVRAKQDQTHTTGEFLRDLKKATRRKSS